jgi:hypothetical protein
MIQQPTPGRLKLPYRWINVADPQLSLCLRMKPRSMSHMGQLVGNFAAARPLLDVYDIASDSWRPLSNSAPNPRDHTGGSLIHDRWRSPRHSAAPRSLHAHGHVGRQCQERVVCRHVVLARWDSRRYTSVVTCVWPKWIKQFTIFVSMRPDKCVSVYRWLQVLESLWTTCLSACEC